MKCHCLILCAVALALAAPAARAASSYVQDGGRAYGQVHADHYNTYLDYGPGPVVDAHGVPQDTPEVQAAKAEHFVAHAAALALANKQPASGQYEGHYQGQDEGQYVQQQYQSSQGYSLQAGQGYHHIHKRGVTYSTPYQLTSHQQPLVASVPQQSVPIETPEVQQAKTAHFLAHSKASQGSNSWSFAAGGYPSQQQTSSLVKFAVNHQTQGYNTGYNTGAQYTTGGYNTGAQYTSGGYQNTGAQYTNRGYQNTGAQYTTGGYQNSGAQYTTGGYQNPGAQYATAGYSTGSYSNAGHGADYSGEYYVPTLTKQGVPEDTPEVKAAKAEHFLALARAKSASLASDEVQYNTVSPYSQSYGHSQQGLPQAPAETPEVQQAKAAHFAAHAAERARQSKYAPAQAAAQPAYTHSYGQGQASHY